MESLKKIILLAFVGICFISCSNMAGCSPTDADTPNCIYELDDVAFSNENYYFDKKIFLPEIQLLRSNEKAIKCRIIIKDKNNSEVLKTNIFTGINSVLSNLSEHLSTDGTTR